jgi:hypothetical protein
MIPSSQRWKVLCVYDWKLKSEAFMAAYKEMYMDMQEKAKQLKITSFPSKFSVPLDHAHHII